MKVNVRLQDGVVVVAPHGEINFENTAMIAQAIQDRLPEQRHFLIDLTNVPYMDSTSLGTVLDAVRIVRGHDGDIRLSGLSRSVKRVFELVNAESVIKMFPTEADGVTSFGELVEQDSEPVRPA